MPTSQMSLLESFTETTKAHNGYSVTTRFRLVPEKAIVMANVFGRHGWIEELVTRVLKPYHPLDGSSEATGSRTSTAGTQTLSKHAQVVGNRCHINGVHYGYLSDRFFKIAFCLTEDCSDSLLGASKSLGLSSLSGKTMKIIRARIMLWEKDFFLDTSEIIVHGEEAESVNMFMASSPCYIEVSAAEIHNDVSSTPYTFRDQLIQEIGQCKLVQAMLVNGPFKNFIRSTYLMDQVDSRRLPAINSLYGSVEQSSFSSSVDHKESLVPGYGCVDTQQSQDESLGDRAAMDGVRNTPSVGDDAEECAQGVSSVACSKFRNEVDLDVAEHSYGNAAMDAASVNTAVVICSNPSAMPTNSSNDSRDTGNLVLDKATRTHEEAFILQVHGERGGVKISEHGDILLYRGLLASNSARVIYSKPHTQSMDYLVKLVRVGSTLLKQSDTLQGVGLLMAAAHRPLELGFVRLSKEEENYLEYHFPGYRNEAGYTADTSMDEVAHYGDEDESVSSSEASVSDTRNEDYVLSEIDEGVESVSSSEASLSDTSDEDYVPTILSKSQKYTIVAAESLGNRPREKYTTVTAEFWGKTLGLVIELRPFRSTRPSNVVIEGIEVEKHDEGKKKDDSQRSRLSKGDYLVSINGKPLLDYFCKASPQPSQIRFKTISPVVDLLSRTARPVKLVFRRYEARYEAYFRRYEARRKREAKARRNREEEKKRKREAEDNYKRKREEEEHARLQRNEERNARKREAEAKREAIAAQAVGGLQLSGHRNSAVSEEELRPRNVSFEDDEVSVEDEGVRVARERSNVDLAKKPFLEIDKRPATCEKEDVENTILNNPPTQPSVAASSEQEEEETMVVESSSEHTSPARNSEKNSQQENCGEEFSNGDGLRRRQTRSSETQDALVSLMEEESDNGRSHITRYEENIASPSPRQTFLRTQAKLEADFDSEMKKIPNDDVGRRETIKRRFVRLKHTLRQEAPILLGAEEITKEVPMEPCPKRQIESNLREIRKFLQVAVDKYYKGQRLSLDMLQVSLQNHFGFDLSAQRRLIEEIYLDLEREKKRLQEQASLLEAHHNEGGKFRYIACAGALWRTGNNATTVQDLSNYGGERVEAEECPVLPEESLALADDSTAPPSKRAINFPGKTSNLIGGVPKKIKLEGDQQPKVYYRDI